MGCPYNMGQAPPNTGLGGGFKTEGKVARLIVGRTKGFSRIPKNVAKEGRTSIISLSLSDGARPGMPSQGREKWAARLQR